MIGRPSGSAPPTWHHCVPQRGPARPPGAGQSGRRSPERSPDRPASGPAARRPASGHAAGDTLLLDHRVPGHQRSGSGRSGRRATTIMVPALVLVAVAVLAVALLTGHVLKFGPLSGDKHKAGQGIRSVAPQLPLAAVTLDTYPGQDGRGVFQSINRVVASGNTIVTMGSQTSDGVVRQQFLVSTNAGASLASPRSAPPAAIRAPRPRSATRPRYWPAAREAGWPSARRPSGPARPARPGPSRRPAGSARSCTATRYG